MMGSQASACASDHVLLSNTPRHHTQAQPICVEPTRVLTAPCPRASGIRSGVAVRRRSTCPCGAVKDSGRHSLPPTVLEVTLDPLLTTALDDAGLFKRPHPCVLASFSLSKTAPLCSTLLCRSLSLARSLSLSPAPSHPLSLLLSLPVKSVRANQ